MFGNEYFQTRAFKEISFKNKFNVTNRKINEDKKSKMEKRKKDFVETDFTQRSHGLAHAVWQIFDLQLVVVVTHERNFINERGSLIPSSLTWYYCGGKGRECN